jgi:hypothetical protein
MARVRRFAIPLIALLALTPMTALGGDDGDVSREPSSPEVVVLRETYGLSRQAAEQRLIQQDQAGLLEDALRNQLGSDYAGAWIHDTPEFVVSIAVVRGMEARAGAILASSPLASAGRVVSVERSLDELTGAARTLRSRTALVPFDLDVDVVGNRLVVYATSEQELADYLTDNGLALPPFAVVEIVDALAEPAATIYGGLALSCGTSGFSVKSTVSGERGITAAGHCGNSQSFQGQPLAWRTTRFFGNHDEAWFSAPGLFTVTSGWINDGVGGRSITSVRHRDNQAIGALVCKYGKTTGFDCGYITSKTHAPSYVPNAAATFILAKKDGVDMASGGDSGGPIFVNNTALGIVSGSRGSNNIDQVIYVAINYVEAGMSVKVTFPGQ